MNKCGCCITEDNKVIICPKHYRNLLQDSNVNYSLVTDVKTSKMFGITIVETGDKPGN